MGKALSNTARAGFAIFALLVVLLHFLSLEINPLSQGISYYALGKYDWLFTASLLFLSIGCLALTVFLWRGPLTVSGYIGASLLIAWTLLLNAAAFFAMDAPGSSPTFAGRVHSCAALSFLLLPPAAFFLESSLNRVHPHRPDRFLGLSLAWAVTIASVLLITFNGFLVSLGIGGAVQRGYWITVLVWLYFLTKTGPEERKGA